MKKFLLLDIEGTIPVTVVNAENEEDAIIKAIKGLLKDEMLSTSDICEALNITLQEINSIKEYE